MKYSNKDELTKVTYFNMDKSQKHKTDQKCNLIKAMSSIRHINKILEHKIKI